MEKERSIQDFKVESFWAIQGTWSAPTGTFENGTEGEGDQKRLQAAVGRDASNRLLDDFKVPGLDSQLVDKNGREEGPADADCTIDDAIGGRPGDLVERHAELKSGKRDTEQGGEDCSQMGGGSSDCQQVEQEADGKCSGECGKPHVTEGVIDLLPGHGEG